MMLSIVRCGHVLAALLSTGLLGMPAFATPTTVTDLLGRQVKVNLPVQRVILGEGRQLYLVAALDTHNPIERIVGWRKDLIQSDPDTYNAYLRKFPAIAKIPTFGGFEDGTFDIEQAISQRPDVIILNIEAQHATEDARYIEKLEAIGIPVVYLDMETPESLYTDLRTIGAIFGNPERAEALVRLYQANTQRVADAIKDVPEYAYPTTVVLQYSSKGGEISFKVPPASYLQTTLVEMAGGIPVWKESQNFGGWAVITLEQIAVWDPQVIFLIDYSGNATEVVEGLKQDPTWQNLKAVQSNLLLPFPSDFLSWDQADARWGMGLLWMASKLQPGQFEGINFVDEVKAFCRDYYGLGDAVITEKVLPLVKGL